MAFRLLVSLLLFMVPVLALLICRRELRKARKAIAGSSKTTENGDTAGD